MDDQQIMTEINDIFRDVMDNPKITVNQNTSAKDIEEWDSLNHIQLVVAIEKRYKIKFTAQEIIVWKNVGDIVNSLKAKLKIN